MSSPAYPAQKRYTYRILGLMTVYGLLLVLASWLFAAGYAEGAAAWAIALLPALPIIGVFAVIGRLLVELNDEYVRMLMVRQSMIASAFMLTLVTGWGFLEDFGLVPHLPAYYAAIVWFAGLGFGGCVNALLERNPRAA